MLLLMAALMTATMVMVSPVAVQSAPASAQPEAAVSSGAHAATGFDMCRAAGVDRLEDARGIGLLQRLSGLPVAKIAAFAAEHPDAISRVLDDRLNAERVAQWWRSLPAVDRSALAVAVPELVGNLDGIPFADRNAANRAMLKDSIERLEEERAAAGRSTAATIGYRIEALDEIRRALGPGDADPRRTLVSLRIAEQPTAAIALGDLDRADYVSYLIPGMFFGVRTQIGAWTDTAARLYDEQRSWLRVLSAADDLARQRTVASVAWIGYQTPDLLNVGSLDLARQGRDALARSIDGLKAARGAQQPFVSVLAHSYGSTAALMALSETPTAVDALALVGSPGSPARSVDELHVRAGNVFVGEAGWDPIPNSAFFGSDPGAAEYGARIMSVAGGVDVITNELLAASSGHNAYFEQGTESLRNLALIAIDRGALVTDGSSRDAGRTLAMLQDPKP